MSESSREALLVDKLRKAYSVILDMLVYSPDYLHGSPVSDYKEAAIKAQSWLESEYGKENGGKIRLVTLQELASSTDDDLL